MAWWPQTQRAWRLSDDDRGWRADVAFVVEYEWGRGKHMPCLTPERVRLPDSADAGAIVPL
jgi:hypothetical protein